MSLSTRVSEKCSHTLREYARRTGKSLGEVLDHVVSYAASQPGFEAYMADDGEPPELRTADDLLNVPTLKDEPGLERARASLVGTMGEGLSSVEITLAGPDGLRDPAEASLAGTTDEASGLSS